jgi:predicted SAM-dependent methyltransferase
MNTREREQKPSQIVERITCCLNENDTLEHLFTFNNFPVFMGCSNEPKSNDIAFNMEWFIGKESGLIQLKKLLPLDVLYADSHGAGEVGAIWDKHHSAFAKFISKFSPHSVFEIGGGHGILAKKYQEYKKTKWTILEPNPTPKSDCPASFITGFFDNDFRFDEPFDTVIHSHVLEHIYEPLQFMKHLEEFTKIGDKLIFTLPNMKKMLERKYTNCINFEHTYFITEPYIEYLLEKFNFKIIEKEYFLEDHSIFYSALRSEYKNQTVKFTNDLYKENKLIFNEYIKYFEKEIEDINAVLKNTDKKVYLFGAHIFAQYLIAFGLDTSKIVCLLDNDKNKQNRRLYGTNLTVHSPVSLKDVSEPIVILKAGVYNNEIKSDIIKNINPAVTFLE